MKIKLFVIAIFAICTAAFSQDILEEQYKYAENLYAAGNYFDAVTEGKRLIFADSAGRFAYRGNLLIAFSYKAGGKTEEAIKYFSLAKKYSYDEVSGYIARLEAIKCLIIQRSASALTLLRGLEKDYSADYSIYGTPSYWRGWYWLMSGEPRNASESFKSSPEGAQLALFCDSINNEKYSVNFGRSISYLVPGSGLIYAGEYYKGLMSLLWNSLSIWLTVDAFNNLRAVDGVLLGSLLWLRFYFGGINNTQKEINNRNNEIMNSAIKYLENNYIGLKP